MLEKGILLPGVGNARQLGGYRIKDKSWEATGLKTSGSETVF